MSDWDDDVPAEQPLTRGQRFRDSIARAVIRPGSAATGEQILRFQEDQGDSYDKVGLIKALDRDQRSLTSQKKWVDETMGWIKHYSNMADYHKEKEDRGPLDRDPNSFERKEERRLDKSRRKSSFYMDNPDVVDFLPLSQIFKKKAEEKERQLLAGETSSFGYPRVTNKHVTLAALLGKRSVDKVLTERRVYSNADKDIENEDYIDYDEGTGYHGEYTINSVAVGKALHKRKTRTMSRGDRLKERIAPYHVGVYEETDAYGGREEGGWFYNTGELVHESRPFITKRGAFKEKKRLEKQYPTLKDRGKQRSVLNMSASDTYQVDKDQGVFDAIPYTDNFAAAFDMPSTFLQTPEDEDYDYSMFGQPSEDYRVYVTRGKPTKTYPQERPYYS